MKLYEISEKYREAMGRIGEADGEIDESIEASLDALGGALVDKVEACCVVMLELDAESSALDVEIKRLQARKKATEAGRERLSEYVRRCLDIAGERKVKGSRLTVSIRSSESVQVDDQAAIPVEYLRTKTVVEPDKTAIKAAIKAGAEVPGVQLVTRESVQVK